MTIRETCFYADKKVFITSSFLKRFYLLSYILSGLSPAALLPQKRFVISDNFYSFGPLSLFKKPTWKRELKADSSSQEVAEMQSIESTNMDIIRLTNTGKYKCNVDLAWENIDDGSR